MKRLAINLLKTIVAAAIYAAIFWYSLEELGMDPSALLADQEAENDSNDS